MNYQLNPLADGNEYQKIYEHFRGDYPDYQVRFGIHNRVTVPFLASLLPGENTVQNFFIVNTIFALMSLAALFYLMQSFGISIPYNLLSLVFFSLHYGKPTTRPPQPSCNP